MEKATHFGTCQVCGRLHKAPGNLMAKHGYTVQWNFFNGVCWGADHQPFELDKEIAQKAHDMQQAAIDGHLFEIAKLQNTVDVRTDEHGVKVYTVWKHEYVKSAKWGKSGSYEWLQVEVIFKKSPHGDHLHTHYRLKKDVAGAEASTGTWKQWEHYGIYTSGPAELIHKLEEPRVSMHEQMIRQLNDYRDWQAKRIASWKPSKMKPVKEETDKKNHVVKHETKGYVASTYGRGGWHNFYAYYTDDIAKAKRYTPRGATGLISKLRGYKTMKAVAL